MGPDEGAGMKTSGKQRRDLISVAGYDPSGGAGISLDIRVFEGLGFRGFGVLTAVTAQNTSRVAGVLPIPPAMVVRQFETLAEEHAPAGLKIGMTGSAGNLKAVRTILRRSAGIPRVVDTILRSTSGMPLAGAGTPGEFLDALCGEAELMTPNLEEAAVLSGIPTESPGGMEKAAVRLFEMTGNACLVKGGRRGRSVLDVLYDGKDVREFVHDRLPRNVHGTGCFLSAAILAYLASGRGLPEACSMGISLIGKAMAAAPGKAGRRTSFSFPL